MITAVLVAHAASTLMMAGLIWFVQLVHYPLFARLEPATAPAYEREHHVRTTWIVAPLMLTEAATAAYLVFLQPDGWRWSATLIAFALLLLIWISTAFVQVPEHARLEKAFDAAAIRRLVLTNWIRTVAWTARAGIALALLVRWGA